MTLAAAGAVIPLLQTTFDPIPRLLMASAIMLSTLMISSTSAFVRPLRSTFVT